MIVHYMKTYALERHYLSPVTDASINMAHRMNNTSQNKFFVHSAFRIYIRIIVSEPITQCATLLLVHRYG